VALVPFAVGIALDAYGTVILLRALGHKTTLRQMLPVRVASEALHLSVPAGVVASDTATAALLQGRCDVPLGDGVVASLARRWLVMRAHAAYIAFGALVGCSTLAALSVPLIGRTGLPVVVLASALVPLALSNALGAAVLGRSTFSAMCTGLRRLPWPALTRWLDARRDAARATDRQVVRLRAAHRFTARATAVFLLCWCLEGLESALMLRLVGADIGLACVFAFEAGMSLVRSAAVIAPSGLGVVDLGYATVLPALGADVGVAPAFVLLKRTKELAWVLAGYAILAASRGRSTTVLPTASPAT
jgi:hypothetical protein